MAQFLAMVAVLSRLGIPFYVCAVQRMPDGTLYVLFKG